VLGLGLGLFILLLAISTKSLVPALISDFISTAVVFSILLISALIEMPVMVVAIRLLANTTISRRVIQGAFLFYVSFALVYAFIFVLLVENEYLNLGMLLAALCLVRFASGVFVR
jgi:hypothetical protein